MCVADLHCLSSLKPAAYFKSPKVVQPGGTGSYIYHQYDAYPCVPHSSSMVVRVYVQYCMYVCMCVLCMYGRTSVYVSCVSVCVPKSELSKGYLSFSFLCTCWWCVYLCVWECCSIIMYYIINWCQFCLVRVTVYSVSYTYKSFVMFSWLTNTDTDTSFSIL